MKKLSFIVMACLLALGLTQCKKNEPIDNNNTDDGNHVSITLKLDNGGEKGISEEDNGGQKVHPTEENGLANIVYDNGDVVYVGSNGKYMGYLTYNGTFFAGSINAAATEGQPLQFIMMGGQDFHASLTENSTTEYTFNIGDQSNGLAVISCAASNENFSLTNLSYTTTLRNKCALVKFDLGEESTDAITLTGMKTQAAIHFDGTVTNGTVTNGTETGNIVTYGTGSTRYAVVLSDQTVVSDGTIRVGEQAVGTFSIPTAAYTNAFLTNATMTFGSSAVPLTLEALTAGSIVVVSPQSGMQYAMNGGAKTAITTDITINVNNGDKVAFYGNGTDITSYSDINLNGTKIGGNAQVKAYGNIMSLVDETGYATCTTLPNGSSYNFAGLFFGNENLTNASGLLLPATTLTPYCYMAMFANCTSLTAAPALPAETLADGCYGAMFQGCTSLTTAPTLSATTLASTCYYSMFQGCTNLTTAPALSATTLAQNCYANMFKGCTSLQTAPALPATTLALSCYSNMFDGCTSLTTAPELPATTLAESCYSYMFNGCTSLTTAPELPATTLTTSCYSNMFNGCTSLKSVTCLATSNSATDCTDNWLNNAGTGSSVTGERKTFSTPGTTSWNTNASGIPARWIRLNPDGSFWNEPVNLDTPLTLLALTDGTIKVINPKSGMKYSVSGGAKTYVTTEDIVVFAGDRVRFYGNSNKYKDTKISGGSAEVKVYGNIMSLLYEENYSSANALSESWAFCGLFQGNTKLIDASGLKLPATTLTSYCYDHMFSECESLTMAPAELPAISLATECYASMFYHCLILIAAPSLPATTLANGCYTCMFQECYELTTVPASLPATTLTEHCYHSMFQSCRNLTTAPVLPATALVPYCYISMFAGCYKLNSITCLATSGINETYSTGNWMSAAGNQATGTKTFTRASTAIWPLNSIDGIPSGWTVNPPYEQP